jgi:hypothetical protein
MAHTSEDKMNCKELQQLVFEYVDDTLSKDVRSLIENHLTSCPECRELVRQEQALKTNIPLLFRSSIDHLKIDANMRQAILATAKPEVSRITEDYQHASLFSSEWLAVAASLMVIGLAGLLLYVPEKSKHPAPSYISSIATVYSDKTRTSWTKRTLIIHKSNGSESYLKIVVTKPSRSTVQKKGEKI